jgi:hypothetical protein
MLPKTKRVSITVPDDSPPSQQQSFTLGDATELLQRASLRLETNGIGYQIAHGKQILVGCSRKNYELSIQDVVEFTRRALER